MDEVTITVRPDGSYRVTGPARLVDVDGNEFPVDSTGFSLCRCGHSLDKPFCDGSHKRAGFRPGTRANPGDRT